MTPAHSWWTCGDEGCESCDREFSLRSGDWLGLARGVVRGDDTGVAHVLNQLRAGRDEKGMILAGTVITAELVRQYAELVKEDDLDMVFDRLVTAVRRGRHER